MTDLVPPDRIERLVGVPRDPRKHYGRAVSAEETVYILHSGECRVTTRDLRTCRFSVALDQGIDQHDWWDVMDLPVLLGTLDGRLVPLTVATELLPVSPIEAALAEQEEHIKRSSSCKGVPGKAHAYRRARTDPSTGERFRRCIACQVWEFPPKSGDQ